MITEIEIHKLIGIAKEARKYAFAFKSLHNIGASVITSDGQMFGGCNIDAVISSQGICAEMSAINHCVVHGIYSFKAICVVDEVLTFPCGACLQYMSQFGQVNDTDLDVVVAKESGEYEVHKLSELLPKQYKSKTFDFKLKTYFQEK